MEQIHHLVGLGVPGAELLVAADSTEPDGVDFVVIADGIAEELMRHVHPGRGHAFVDLTPRTSLDFSPIDGITLPAAPTYLVRDVDLGAEFFDETPDAALEVIRARRRSPLTIAEGIAILLQLPDALEDHNAFSLAGSRAGDARVPALWTSRVRDRRGPRLGWCWGRNPHSWLGVASCGDRSLL